MQCLIGISINKEYGEIHMNHNIHSEGKVELKKHSRFKPHLYQDSTKTFCELHT